jgi:CDP-diacylglycerol--glycerol-3-phosphate 3-phosphatidyltransferase
MSYHALINWPNFLTVMRICLTPLFVVMLLAEAWHWKSLAFVVFGAASLTDFYDGKLARSGNRETSVGRFLDPLADKILVTSALLALVFGKIVSIWLVVPIVVRDVLITGLRVYGLYHGRQMITSRLAKWKTALQLFTVVFLLFVIGLQEILARFHHDEIFPFDEGQFQLLANGLMSAVLLLTLLSGFHYLVRRQLYLR